MNNAVQLLEDMVREEINPTAAAIVKLLRTSGALSLKEIADRLTTSPIPEDVRLPGNKADCAQAIRALLSQLVAHNYVSFDTDDELYRSELGTGTCRALFPLIVHHVQKHFGASEASIVTTLQQHAAVNTESLIDLTTRRAAANGATAAPTQDSALRSAVQTLIASGYLVALVDTKLRGGISAPAAKKQRTEGGGGGGGITNDAPMELNYLVILSKLRSDVADQLLATTHRGLAVQSIIKCLLKNDSNRQPSKPEFGHLEFPSFPATSSPVALSFIQRSCPQVQAMVASNTLTSLCSVEGGEVVMQRLTRSSGNDGGAEYMLSYGKIFQQEKLRICESLISSRFGPTGLRVVRLLMEKRALDERQVAEETLTALGDVRNVLTELHKEGYLQQLELPKINTADRQFKNSIFLWKLSEATIYKVAGDCLAKVARTMYAKLRLEQEQVNGGRRGQLDAALAALGFGAADPVQHKLDEQRSQALSGALFSTLHAVFILHYC